jgi:hypothetical protein
MTIFECPTEPKNPSASRRHSRAAAGFEGDVAGSIGIDTEGIAMGGNDAGDEGGTCNGEAVFFIDLGL